jgi:predicted GIY-YIG superfamily endonuclease
MPYVYLIHFDEPVGGGQHYTGFARDIDHLHERIAKHRSSVGASMTTAANKRGVSWRVVRLFRVQTYRAEKVVKYSTMLLCPHCRTPDKLRLASPGNAALGQAAD